MTALVDLATRAWQSLLAAHLAWVAVALALYCFGWLVSSERWRVIVRALGGRLGWRAAMLATIAGVCVNNLTPTGRLGGEACRIAITRLRGQLSLTRGALATIGDRLTDVPAVAIMLLIALPVLPPVLGGYAPAALVALVIVAALLAASGPWLRQLARTSLAHWRREGAHLGWPDLARVLSLSGLLWTEDVLRMMAVGRAFDVELSVSQASALGVVGVLGGFVPAVAGLGPVEGALVGTLVLFGIPLETTLAMTAVERIVSYGLSTSLGGVVVMLLGGRRLWRQVSADAGAGSAAPATAAPAPPRRQ